MEFINQIKERAKTLQNKIVLPEGTDLRTLKAVEQVIADNLAQIILLGDPIEIKVLALKEGINITGAEIINPKTSPKREQYAALMVEIRKDKGLTTSEALDALNNPLVFGSLMVKAKDADGEIAGAINSTGDVLRPALQYIKTVPGVSVVSGVFFMVFKDKSIGDNGILVFADCAVMPDPTDRQLAEIAVSTAKTAESIAHLSPRVAMLSFSTKGSAKHPLVDKMTSATRIAKELDPELIIDGELQLDAALIESVGLSKAPGSTVAGKANILIFPGLESANIGYKLVQRLAGAEAIGPILQGMAAPINDLSRGCSVADIVNLVAITATQAG
ncbi:MAG: phosphate acetyltransferase [Bacteroidia bacterium]|nr:phosphate acetyltransferase [Bacteroidia bacterium]